MASNDRLIEFAILGLRAERDRIDRELSALEARIGKNGLEVSVRAGQTTNGSARKLSEAGRRRISAAMKLRWAKRRLEAKPGKSVRISAVATKSGISDEGRKKLSAMMKKRWADKRKAAKRS